MTISYWNSDITCIHCGVSLSGESFQIAVYLYGVFFLVGKEDGYIGTTCPSCIKTTCYKKSLVDIERSKQDIHDIVFFEGKQFHNVLRYFSPYISSPESNHDIRQLIHFAAPIYKGENYIEDLEQRILQYEMDEVAPHRQQNLYRTYIYDFAQPCGSFFYTIWLDSNQVDELVQIENETELRIIPRYIHRCFLLEAVEDLCWQHAQNHERLTQTLNAQEGIERFRKNQGFSRRKFPPVSITGTKEYLEQCKEEMEKDTSMASEFNDILTDNSGPWNTPTGMYEKLDLLRKTLYPYLEAKQPVTLDTLDIKSKRTINTPDLLSLEDIKDSFNKDFAQEFLTTKSHDFINDYIESLKKSDWSFASFWRIKTNYFRQYQNAVYIGLRHEAKYSFFKEGEAYTITFNGKRITGLKQGGFKYIHYLVCNENQHFSPKKLNELDYGKTVAASIDYSKNSPIEDYLSIEDKSIAAKKYAGLLYDQVMEIPQDMDGERTFHEGDESFELFDEKARKELLEEIEKLEKQLYEARVAVDQVRISEIMTQRDELKKFYDEALSPGGKIKKERGEYKKIQSRIGNSIARAIKHLDEKGYKHAAKHFHDSINPYANQLSYISADQNIKWFV